MRGVPGSGKSTVANHIKGENGVIHSTDNYFMNENGDYVFDKTLLGKHHQQNLEGTHFLIILDFKLSIDSGIKTVIVDNTNTKKWEFGVS